MYKDTRYNHKGGACPCRTLGHVSVVYRVLNAHYCPDSVSDLQALFPPIAVTVTSVKLRWASVIFDET